MANLSNMKVNSKVHRLNNMIVRGAIDVGYTGFAGGSGLSITVRNPDRESDTARDFRLELSQVDTGLIIERLLNPIGRWPIIQFASNKPPSYGDTSLYAELLEEHGIKYTLYKYPAPSFADGTERWYWAAGINRYHAEHQMARLIKSFDPALLEEHKDE